MRELARRRWWANGVAWCAIGLALLLACGLLMLLTLGAIAVAVTGAGGGPEPGWLTVWAVGCGVGGASLLVGLVMAWRQHRAGVPVARQLRRLAAGLVAVLIVLVLLGTTAWWLLPAGAVLYVLLRSPSK